MVEECCHFIVDCQASKILKPESTGVTATLVTSTSLMPLERCTLITKLVNKKPDFLYSVKYQ